MKSGGIGFTRKSAAGGASPRRAPSFAAAPYIPGRGLQHLPAVAGCRGTQRGAVHEGWEAAAWLCPGPLLGAPLSWFHLYSAVMTVTSNICIAVGRILKINAYTGRYST